MRKLIKIANSKIAYSMTQIIYDVFILIRIQVIVGRTFYYHTIVIQDIGLGVHISALLHTLVSLIWTVIFYVMLHTPARPGGRIYFRSFMSKLVSRMKLSLTASFVRPTSASIITSARRCRQRYLTVLRKYEVSKKHVFVL